jgi:hypothetical protein
MSAEVDIACVLNAANNAPEYHAIRQGPSVTGRRGAPTWWPTMTPWKSLAPYTIWIKLGWRARSMLRRIVRCLVIAMAAAAASATANARRWPPVDATPFAHAPCSLLGRRPCTPTFCSVFNHGPCIPEIFYPYGENLQLTIESVPSREDAAKYRRPDHDLDTIADLFAELRSCWSPPPADSARQGMQMSVRFSFKRSGELIGAPRVTYATASVPADVRDTYLKAINASLEACAPLKFTGGLGGALAGRPIAIRYVDNRQLHQTGR